VAKLGKAKREKRIKIETYAQLKREADKVCSDYVRQRDNWTCITCGHVGTIKDIQSGHYIERNKIGTRFDEKNNNAQCVDCNVWKKGNLRIYATKLEAKYGQGILQELEEKAATGKGKVPRAFLIEVIIYYTEKLQQLKNN